MDKVVSSKKKNLYINLKSAGLVALLTILVLIAVMKINRIVPFGNNSFASHDATYQYLDFFAYYKDVLDGKNSIRYTLTSGLGMSAIGIFAYYLTSPFNFLIVFFSKSNLNSFFSLLVVLKMATAGALMAVFLNERSQYRLKQIFTILLSLAYALMQYNFAQSNNIMWLDGVYMLPLILLGTYYTARRNKTLFLTITVAISIFFQWYTAGINCLYSIIWFAMELAFVKENDSISSKEMIKRTIHYLWGMFLGVLISMILFWPNIIAMLQGKGSFDWSYLKPTFKGNVIQTVLRYSIGSVSDKNAVALFCGGLVLLGIIGFFTSECFSRKEKTIAGIMTAFSVMIFYWQPLFFLYSLLKDAASYWFRYSYVTIFFLIFLASLYFRNWNEENDLKPLLKGSVIFSVILLILKFADNEDNLNLIYYTIICVIVEAVLLNGIKKNAFHRNRRVILASFLCLIAVCELFENGKTLMEIYKATGVDYYKQYTNGEEQQLASVKKADTGLYRISQTVSRNENVNNVTANYDESMAYGYNGIASYTSSPQMNQLQFLNKLGYKIEADCISVVNTSILPVDSLLGVKYILANSDITGYKKLNNIPVSGDGKKAYINPYALPMAFTYTGDNKELKSKNPFEYVNAIYSRLSGHKVNVFRSVSYERSDDAGEIDYHLYNINVNGPVYGNIPSRTNSDAVIDVNGEYTQSYACWLSPSVFYIPVSDSEADLKVTAANQMEFSDPQFYVCDLNALASAVKEITSHQAKITSYKDGEIIVSASCKDSKEKLFLSVPYNSGWSVKVNGRVSQVKSFEKGMLKVNLDKGENKIEFHYTVPGLKAGAILSLSGIILLIITQIVSARSIRKRKEAN